MLDDAAIERYARQIVVPGIGAAGQERLLESTVLVVGHPRGCATAALYLRAAGVNLDLRGRRPGAIVIANPSNVDADSLARQIARAVPICWYEAEEDGFAAGVHPASALPGPSGPRRAGATPDAMHDAGACAAAALACAVILGLELLPGETRLAT